MQRKTSGTTDADRLLPTALPIAENENMDCLQDGDNTPLTRSPSIHSFLRFKRINFVHVYTTLVL